MHVPTPTQELMKSENAIVSALNASEAAGRSRLAQEEELARMLEQQLPFSWGPRGLEQQSLDVIAGQQDWRPAGPRLAQHTQHAQQQRAAGREGSGGSRDGERFHHHSHHPETWLEPWRQPQGQQVAGRHTAPSSMVPGDQQQQQQNGKVVPLMSRSPDAGMEHFEGEEEEGERDVGDSLQEGTRHERGSSGTGPLKPLEMPWWVGLLANRRGGACKLGGSCT